MQARSRARSSRGGLTPDQQRLVSTAVTTVSVVPSLCSPAGSLTVLPTVLYLVTGALKEAASKPPGDKTVVADSTTVTACLQALDRLVAVRYLTFM